MKAILTLEDHDDNVRITLELDPPLDSTEESTPALGLASHLVKVIQEMIGNQDTNPTN